MRSFVSACLQQRWLVVGLAIIFVALSARILSEARFDAFELALARAADERGLPVLAICRGAQVVNVARGGALHQHLPDVVGEAVQHRQTAAACEPTHPVTVAPRSRLATMLGRGRVEVNSFHHQAASRIGEGLVPSAWAPDGTPFAVLAMTVRGGKVVAIDVLADPERLRDLDLDEVAG